VVIEVGVARSRVSLAAPLEVVRENPAELYLESGKEIRSFGVDMRRNLGLKRDAGRGSFIDSVAVTTKEFYRDVLQDLRTWQAPPPKLERSKQDALSTATPAIEDVIDDAATEAEVSSSRDTEEPL
jgi:hypothetical protein